MFEALKRHAARHALFYVIAMGLGLQAFGTAFYDNFYSIPPGNMTELGWWQVVALILKTASVSIGIVVGYLIRSPSQDKADAAVGTSGTTPPFESATTATTPAKPPIS